MSNASAVAVFCQAAGFDLHDGNFYILPGFAETPLIAGRVITLGTRIAVYAEWPTAVRIDLSSPAGGRNDWRRALRADEGPEQTLALSFDPCQTCGEALLDAKDPRSAVKPFGRKKIRRIMPQPTLETREPTLVQHRLLALAA